MGKDIIKPFIHESIINNLQHSNKKSFSIIINEDGSIECDWWSINLDQILDKLGIPNDDVNRNPLCG